MIAELLQFLSSVSGFYWQFADGSERCHCPPQNIFGLGRVYVAENVTRSSLSCGKSVSPSFDHYGGFSKN